MIEIWWYNWIISKLMAFPLFVSTYRFGLILTPFLKLFFPLFYQVLFSSSYYGKTFYFIKYYSLDQYLSKKPPSMYLDMKIDYKNEVTLWKMRFHRVYECIKWHLVVEFWNFLLCYVRYTLFSYIPKRNSNFLLSEKK